VHSAKPALPLGMLFLTIWRTALFLCLQKPVYTFSFLIVLAHPACSRLLQKHAI